ncbi:MAG: Xylulose kinase [Rhodoglobus sp.]|nr:Xylulose kinase [Rhodoglobus sp.]
MPPAARELFQSYPLASAADIDHARHVLSGAYLPLCFPSASTSTAVDLRINVVKVGRITAGYLRFGGAIRILTAEATDYHIDIPVTGRAVMRAGSRGPMYGTPQTASIFMPGYTAELDCDAEFSQLAIMIPRAELNLELEGLLGRSVTKPLEFAAELGLVEGPGRTVLETLRFIDRVSNDTSGLLQHPLASQRLEQVLMASLLLTQPHNYCDALSTHVAAAGPRPVARAVELLRANVEHAWTVTELANEVAVSVRSLQEGFRRSMDTTPLSYLRELRLEQIHSELCHAEPGSVAVSEVAARWGVTHLGRFAANYQRRFSEKPSETIRRTAKSAH